jgi:hypothetical protein
LSITRDVKIARGLEIFEGPRKPWPFRGWGIDLIGQINPPSSKGHKFVLLDTDYFTKWGEAIPLKKVTSENMVEFVKEHIIYRFGIPQTITTDQGA